MAADRRDDADTETAEASQAFLAVPSFARGESAPGGFASCPTAKQSGSAWMVSFTDLVALLLTFFVMVFAMRDVEENTWQTITNSFVTALDTMDDTDIAAPTFDIDIEQVSKAEGQDLDYLRAVIESLLQDRSVPPIMQLEVRRQAVALRARRADLLREEALALSDDGQAYIFHLAGVLGNLSNAVQLVVQMPGTAASGPAEADWAEALQIAGLFADALADGGYAEPIEMRASWSGAGAAAASPAEATVDILILSDARN